MNTVQKIPFIHAFRAAASQLNGYRIAGEWMRLAEALQADGITLTAADAARWADAGYLPGEAVALILDGVSAEQATELDDLGTDVAGGSEVRAAQRIDELVRAGVLVDPRLVRQRQDPDDPERTIVEILHEQ